VFRPWPPTLLPARCIPGPAGPSPNPSGSRRNGLEGVRTTPATQIRSGGGSSGRPEAACVRFPFRQGMRNNFKPAAFDPYPEDGKSTVFQLFAARRLVRLRFFERDTGSGKKQPLFVKNGTEYCAPGTPLKPDGQTYVSNLLNEKSRRCCVSSDTAQVRSLVGQAPTRVKRIRPTLSLALATRHSIGHAGRRVPIFSK